MADKLKHIIINKLVDIIPYTSVSSGGGSETAINRERISHGEYIQRKLSSAWQESLDEVAVYENTRNGVYVEFQSHPELEMAIMSLENLTKKIRLCNVRKIGDITYATVHIPDSKKEFFFKKITEYISEDTRFHKPKNTKLIEGIDDLRKALLIESFWVDDKNLIPKDDKEWCEVWLRSDTAKSLADFEELLTVLNIDFKEGFIRFPERTVKLLLANKEDLEKITISCDFIAEYRRAKNTADFLLNETPSEQVEWGKDLLDRLVVDENSDISICILDSGVNYSHPFLSPIIGKGDCQTVNSSWGVHDTDEHGTLMAGIAGYGDLQESLEGTHKVHIKHRLESVKIYDPNFNTSPELWGHFTSRAISNIEISNPSKKRISCMAITSDDTRDKGKPSSWSGAVDQIIYGNYENDQKLFFIAAGNNNFYENGFDSIHDPGQAWNAVTVGAYTMLTEITDSDYKGYESVAKQNELSPFSTTSSDWDNQWPIKPEVVFEGGNLAINSDGSLTEADDLRLISTNYRPQDKLLNSFSMTSASTAKAANFAAVIQSSYPEYWAETVRALIIHSAEWTPELKAQFAKNDNKGELLNVLRSCGYGVPDLDRALYCATNSLTLISEAIIQPFYKDGSYKTKDMHLYELPWPRAELERLGETEIEMKITLSYFVEPGAGEIGWKDRYRYQSHGLRFELNAPSESKSEFLEKVNSASRGEDFDKSTKSKASVSWLYGKNQRDKGSIHSDVWKGSALDLLLSKYIAVYPTIGWWRERHHLGKYNKSTRYSLIVSIKTKENEIDIYTPVMTKVSVPITIETEIN